MANLITLQQFKDAEQITNPRDDYKLSRIIDSVSQMVKTYCGNSIVDFHSTDKVETFTIDWATYAVQLTESPVNNIISVQERGSETGSYTTLTANTNYQLETSTDILYRINTIWPQGVNSVVVIYNAGYSDTPADLKLAVAYLVTHYLKGEHKERRTIQGATIQNQKSEITFPDHIKRILDLYKTY